MKECTVAANCDVCGKGLASVMPDWVKQQIEMDDVSTCRCCWFERRLLRLERPLSLIHFFDL